MNQQDWQRFRALFAAAVERPAAERATFLDEACGRDRVLRRQLDLLLGADQEADAFLEEPLIPQLRGLFTRRD